MGIQHGIRRDGKVTAEVTVLPEMWGYVEQEEAAAVDAALGA